MRTLGIYTNCQGRFINELFLSNIPYFTSWTIVYLENFSMIAKGESIKRETLESFDVFLYQPVSEKHGIYSTLNETGILGMLRSDCLRISFPSLYVDMWPIYEDTGFYYGGNTILQYKESGFSLDSIHQLYDNNVISFQLKERYEKSLNYLILREANCTIKTMSAYIDKQKDTEPIFHTQNHPTPKTLYFLLGEICKCIQLHFGETFDFSIDSYDQEYIKINGQWKDSRYMKSELGLQYVEDNSEYYKQLITLIYYRSSIVKTRNYDLNSQ